MNQDNILEFKSIEEIENWVFEKIIKFEEIPSEVRVTYDSYKTLRTECLMMSRYDTGPSKPKPPVKCRVYSSGLFHQSEKEEFAYDDPIYKHDCEVYLEEREKWRQEQRDKIGGDFIINTSGGPIKIKMRFEK